MSEKPDLVERIGTAINELDIDFNRFTVVGWIVSLLSLATGGGIAFYVGYLMVQRNGLDKAAGLVFCIFVIGVTTVTFIALRSLFVRIGFPVTNNCPSATEVAAANQNTLQRMADAGMDMSVDQMLDFWHRFKLRKNAESMSREAKQLGYRVGPIETNNESGGYDVQVRIKLVPTLEAVNRAERTLASLAERNGGHADGWGSKQVG